MSVTIVETPGSASANSFVSVAEADAYLEARLNSSAWTGTEPKKQALVEATRELDLLAWSGARAGSTQALSWPRDYVEDPDSPSCAYFGSAVIPTRVKNATIELALEFLKAGTSDLAKPDSNANVIRKKIDVLETEYAHPTQRATGVSRFPRVMALVSPLLASSPSSSSVRLVRG